MIRAALILVVPIGAWRLRQVGAILVAGSGGAYRSPTSRTMASCAMAGHRCHTQSIPASCRWLSIISATGWATGWNAKLQPRSLTGRVSSSALLGSLGVTWLSRRHPALSNTEAICAPKIDCSELRSGSARSTEIQYLRLGYGRRAFTNSLNCAGLSFRSVVSLAISSLASAASSLRNAIICPLIAFTLICVSISPAKPTIRISADAIPTFLRSQGALMQPVNSTMDSPKTPRTTTPVVMYPAVSQPDNEDSNAAISRAMDRLVRYENIQFWLLLCAFCLGLIIIVSKLVRRK